MKGYKNFKRIAKKNKSILDDYEGKKLVYLAVALLTALFVIFITAKGGYMSIVFGRLTSFMIILILGYMITEWVSGLTEETEVLKTNEELETRENLHIKEISTLLERASEGQSKSRDILHENIKEIFLIKFKEKEGFSDEDLNEIMEEPERFRELVGDEAISDFILSLKREDINEYEPRKMRLEEYKSEIRKIVKKVGEWD